ncbi:hypothetical protein [Lysinibacillus sp. 54212]|uniref:hypothetical protein n=1 Tax=Lysinibacillus sp. 54212 TaxID=3119829 RepID=UPI002FC7B4E7
MKVESRNINYLIEGKITAIPTRILYDQLDEGEFQRIHFEVRVNNHPYQSKLSDSFEYALKYLQKELPSGICLACCQSCQHGNFNPFGNEENEIFCFRDKMILNRDDVVKAFSKRDKFFKIRSKKLVDFCEDYKPICEKEKYTYNDWGLEELS